MNLREVAPQVPYCMGCDTPNHDRQQLCLAHSNALEDGRGAFHRTPDLFGAFLCGPCHDRVDGRSGGWTKAAKRDYHHRAWIKTMRWLIENKRLVVR